MPDRLGLGVALLAALLPWTPFGMPKDADPSAMFLGFPAVVFTAGVLALAGAGLAALDRYLGLFVLYAALIALSSRSTAGLEAAQWITLGAVGLVAARTAPSHWMRGALLVTAVAQSLIAGLQGLAAWVHGTPLELAAGSFGNSKYLGAYLAVAVPLAPLWLLPVLALGVILSRSWLCALAVLVGLLLRPGMSRSWRFGAASLGVVLGAGTLALRGVTLDTLASRGNAWAVAFADWTPRSLLVGHGLGAWWVTVPVKQINAAAPGWPAELFTLPHSEIVGLVYNAGLVALGLAGAWLVAHRRQILSSPWRGAFAAAAIESLALHPFHLALTAPAYLVVLGLTTRDA